MTSITPDPRPAAPTFVKTITILQGGANIPTICVTPPQPQDARPFFAPVPFGPANQNSPLKTKAINNLTESLNHVLWTPSTSPLHLLKTLIETITSAPRELSSYHIACLLESLPTRTTSIGRMPYARISATYWTNNWPLTQHRLVTVFILLLASSPLTAMKITQAQCKGKKGGMIDYEIVVAIDSCDFAYEYEEVVRMAREEGRTTVMGVQVVDRGVLEMVHFEGVES
ncbi:MAG: hypothetical protein Q9170_007225, partial [Blastenia crenularia]